MKGFEQPVEVFETEEGVDEQKETNEQGRNLSVLWKKYHFKGEAPVADSPVAERLRDICARYAKMAVYPEKIIRPRPILVDVNREGGEDYFAEQRRNESIANLMSKSILSRRDIPSDAEKRELHNQIALMVAGRLRTGMNETFAESIADFACELTYGKTIGQFDEEKTGEDRRLAKIAAKSKPE